MTKGNTRLARRLLWAAGIINGMMLFTSCCAGSLAAIPNPSGVSDSGGSGYGFVVALVVLSLGFGAVALLYATSTQLWFELGKERVFRHTCIGVGFVSEVEGAWTWWRGLEGMKNGAKKTITPRLRNVHGAHDSFVGEVAFFRGQTLEEYNKHAAAFAMSFRVPFVSFDLAENGLITIRAGQVPVPDAYAFTGLQHAAQDNSSQSLLQQAAQPLQAQFKQPVPKNTLSLDEVPQGVLDAAYKVFGSKAVPNVNADYQQGYKQESVHAAELELLKAVPMARDMNGRVCKMPIEGQHWFIAARTGGGKGSWIWSLVLGLKPAWELGLVKFWGCDPKRLELAIGSGWWAHYADTDEGMVEMLEQAVSEMFAVGDMLKGKYRKFTPSRQTPLNVVVIDELGYVSSMLTDKKLQMRASSAIKTLLTQGRSNGYAIIGAAIDVRKETVSFREEFTIRIAGSMSAPMVDLVLGEGMHDAGALCEQIPMPPAGAGVAYVVSERTLKPICVRAAWISDDDIQGMAQGALLPPKRPLNPGDVVQDEYPIPQYGFDGQVMQQGF